MIALLTIWWFPDVAHADDGASASQIGTELWLLIAAALVFLMQLGFLALEVGFVEPKTVTSVAMKNLIDVIIVTLAFFLVGFGVMFGDDIGGMIGGSLFGLEGIEETAGSSGYMESINSAQCCSTILRRTFCVGVTSPSSREKSRGSKRKTLMRS